MHVLVHEAADREEIFRVIAIFAKLLEFHAISHQPLGVPLVAFHELRELFVVQLNFVIRPFKNLL